ncbi:MAG: bacterial Ig-like domain-containing protein [Spirochaetaceae bacterium]|jgi:hypothetical protein|nr:bacterial Ig-like domain-containing protein [Spirochaetaceae bacterium]
MFLNKRNIKSRGGFTKTKKTALIAAICAAFLVQCEVWNKPLIEKIEKISNDEDVQIERLIIEVPPWPNTFNIGVLEPDWKELGLKVSAVYTSGDGKRLDTFDDYKVTGFDSTYAAKQQTIEILPKNGNAQGAEFYIEILDSALDYYSIKPYKGEGGKVIPFPSKIEKNEKDIKVTLYIYPDNGYILESILYKASGGDWKPTEASETDDSNIWSWTFDMPPDGEDIIELNAVFLECEAMRVIDYEKEYYLTLKEAIASVEDHGQGMVSILKNGLTLSDDSIPVTAEKNIMIVLLKSVDIDWTIEISKNITLVTANPEGNSIKRKEGFKKALFNVQPGGVLTLGGGGIS